MSFHTGCVNTDDSRHSFHTFGVFMLAAVAVALVFGAGFLTFVFFGVYPIGISTHSPTQPNSPHSDKHTSFLSPTATPCVATAPIPDPPPPKLERGAPCWFGGGYVHSRLLDSQALQVVFGPVLTHLTFDRLQRTQAIDERMFFAGGSMVAVLIYLKPTAAGFGRGVACADDVFGTEFVGVVEASESLSATTSRVSDRPTDDHHHHHRQQPQPSNHRGERKARASHIEHTVRDIGLPVYVCVVTNSGGDR